MKMQASTPQSRCKDRRPNMANLQVTGQLCDLDNAVTEAENASDRRRIALRLQQKVPRLADICVDHLYKHTKQIESSVLGEDDMSSNAEKEEEEETCVPPSGGRSRA